MKKAVFFVVLVMVLVGSCAAQSASNDAQRIVGTWTQDNGTVWVFNADGTGTKGGDNFFYGISASVELYIIIGGRRGDFYGHKIYMSPDGKRMIIDDVDKIKMFQKK